MPAIPRSFLRLALAGLSLATAPRAEAAQPPSGEDALRLITPLYAALTASAVEEVGPRLRSVTTNAWTSCGINDACEERESVVTRWSRRLSAVPGMRWELKEMLVTGDRIVVRGETTGTPSGAFLGVLHTGRSFRVMTIDVHVIEHGRTARTHHIDYWLGAIRQLRGEAP